MDFLENFKKNILGSLSEQIDTLKIKKGKRLKMLHYLCFVQNVERSMP